MRLVSQKQTILVRNINDENEKNLPPRHSSVLPNTIYQLNVLGRKQKCVFENIPHLRIVNL